MNPSTFSEQVTERILSGLFYYANAIALFMSDIVANLSIFLFTLTYQRRGSVTEGKRRDFPSSKKSMSD
jgi:hypothetical protein